MASVKERVIWYHILVSKSPPPLIFSENASHKIHQSFATNSNSKNRNESKYARLVCLKPKGISKNPFSSSHLICENPWWNSVHLAFLHIIHTRALHNLYYRSEILTKEPQKRQLTRKSPFFSTTTQLLRRSPLDKLIFFAAIHHRYPRGYSPVHHLVASPETTCDQK